MKYEAQSGDRRSRWSLVKDAVDLDMLLAVTDMDSTSSMDPLLAESTQSLNRNSGHQNPRPTSRHLMESSPSLYSGVSYRTSTTSLDTDPGDYAYSDLFRRGSGGSQGSAEDHFNHRYSERNDHEEEENVYCPANCGVCTGFVPSMPKSMSLPLRQVTPDPFPELTTSPITPSSAQIHLDTSARSSPSSPVVAHRPPHSRDSAARQVGGSLPSSKSGSTESMDRPPTPEVRPTHHSLTASLIVTA